MVHYCDATECKYHRSKAKRLLIYPFMADMKWAKWLEDVSAQTRWKVPIRREGEDKTGRNVDVLNLTRNRHFHKEEIRWFTCV